MEYFDASKRTMLEKLYKPDRSFKGNVDEEAIPIIEALNAKENYYTTSSCSGRISLFYEAESCRKDESGWLFVKHGTVKIEELKDSLASLPQETVWFRQETPIFHIACRTDDDAKKLLELCRDLGFKHSGIIGKSKRVMVEVIFNNKMDVPISGGGVLFVNEKFIKFLLKKANVRFKKNQTLLKKFEKNIKKL